jgi:2-polyprenyl-6-methoxyphenol hydroxylase-like FAD-dependent oxidoreductase
MAAIPSSTRSTTSVLIIGAGPTGLMMAAQLALRGVLFRILDKNADHTTQSRALVVQARSLEIFDQMGIAQEAVRLGEKAKGVNIIVRGKQILNMDLRDAGRGLTAFPYLLILEQSKTEKILNDFLAHHGHAVEWNTELVDFTQAAESVTATIRHADGQEETVQADWLVGADGGHSLVRRTLNIPFAGKTYQESLFVLDCEASLALPRDQMTIAFSEKAFTGFFPMSNGRCRVLGTVPEGLEGQDTITFDDVARNFEQRMQMDVQLYNPAWISLYHSHHRVVATFRKGHCFVAGDAAHIHSPVGAQGMNTGLQDAYNLAWKLALITQGKANVELLETYHEERIAIARNLVRTTDRAFNYVNSQHPLIKGFRLHVMPIAMQAVLPLVQRLSGFREVAFKTISEIGIHYRESRLSKQDPHSHFPRHAPKPGDRVPYLPATETSLGTRNLVQGTKFHLVLFVGLEVDTKTAQEVHKLQQAHPDLLACDEVLLSAETLVLYRRFGIKKQGYYFIRPDGYIAYRSSSLDLQSLDEYLRRMI